MEITQPTDLPSQEYLYSESIKQLYQQPQMVFLGSVAVAGTFTAYLFRHNLGSIAVFVWLAGIYLHNILHIALVRKYRGASRSLADARRWGFAYHVSSSTVAAFWGVLALYLSADDLTQVFFYTLVISGIVAGSVPILSYHTPIFSSFALFGIMPFTFQLFRFDSDFYFAFGVLSVFFVVTNIVSARNMQQKTHARIALEYQNRALIDSLRVAKERAEQANLIKTKFLATASHDLRQPLHALGLFVDVLTTRIRFPEVREIVQNIKRSTDSLNGLLNALLDVSGLDADLAKPDISSFAVGPLLEQLKQEFVPQAADKGLAFRVRGSDVWIRSDPVMLERILRNIIVNAIRYTSTGGVLMGCRNRGSDLTIAVCDSGLGIPVSERDLIFEEFHQIDNPERDRQKGLGLGLAIVKRLADLLQHKLEVRSRVGKGSVFSITVPVTNEVTRSDVDVSEYQDDLAGALIVVVDDETDIRVGMGKILETWGCHAVLAESAESAVMQLTQGVLVPDLVVADFRLRDGKTGVQAIERIADSLGHPIPAIVVTGDTAPERLREAKASGFPLLHKPVSAAQLRSLASYLIDRRSG